MTNFIPAAPLARLAAHLDSGATTSRALIETALERIATDGSAVFCQVDADSARRQADAQDALRRAGVRLSPLAGLPVSVKDLFDVAGQCTRAGSRVLDDTPPAHADATAVARLKRAGAVLIGRTNMSEFAFSGIGINPHYGTPASPWRRDERRVAGGSSSGAAVSVADGMAAAGLGSDTGGSLRIPAAFCGLTGFKPTARRMPSDGMVPLSPTLDAAGAIAPTVDCCRLMDRVLAGDRAEPGDTRQRPLASVRLAVLKNYVTDGMEPEIAQAWLRALDRLSSAGAQLVEIQLAVLDSLPSINVFGFSPIEAFAAHRHRLETQAHRYDPRVLARLRRGERATAADYLDLLNARRAAIAAARQSLAGFDAFVMPTVPVAPPRIATLDTDDDAFAAANALVLRNPSVVNFLDGCAVSLPCQREGDAPAGFTLAAFEGEDAALLALAREAEKVLRPATNAASH